MILLFLWGRERMMLAFLMWDLTVMMEFVHALVAGIGQQFNRWSQCQTAVLEQSKVMSFAYTGRHTQNLLRGLVNHDLSLLGMAFLLTGIAATLFFWGRSTLCSLASTTITVKSNEPSCNAFLPGR